jgi:hypothetical protein
MDMNADITPIQVGGGGWGFPQEELALSLLGLEGEGRMMRMRMHRGEREFFEGKGSKGAYRRLSGNIRRRKGAVELGYGDMGE